MGRLLRGISKNGGVIFTALDSTDIVRKMREYHDTSAVTSAALGRLLTAAGLMGTMLKQKKKWWRYVSHSASEKDKLL